MIQARARNFHVAVQEQANVRFWCSYSDGWYHSFSKRYDLKAFVTSGESAFVDMSVVEKFKCELEIAIEMESYLPEQIFNFDETGLMLEKMPSRTIAPKMMSKQLPGTKESKDRATLLLGELKNCYLLYE